MCPKHRSARLDTIRGALKAGQRCIVVSTSLVEAGVDVDFPVVYRAEAGLDSIAQAAGRCNREGRLSQGEVFVFRPAGRRLLGEHEPSRQGGGQHLSQTRDPLAPRSRRGLLPRGLLGRECWGQDGLDKKEILARLEERKGDLLFPFEAIARDFKLIEDGMLPVLIPFDDEARAIAR